MLFRASYAQNVSKTKATHVIKALQRLIPHLRGKKTVRNVGHLVFIKFSKMIFQLIKYYFLEF